MSKKIILIIFYSIVINSIIKGENIEREPLSTIVLENNDKKSNWFINIGTGANVYLNKNEISAPFRKRITLNYNLAGGKWFSTALGLRLELQGGKIHTFPFNYTEQMNSTTYLNIHADLLFNLSNYFTPSLNRRYSFIPNIGMGYIRGDSEAHLFKTNGFNGPTLNGGLLNTYRFSDRVSAYVELNASLVESRFDKQNDINSNNNNWSEIFNLNAGISISLGKTGLKEIELYDIELVDMLNSLINKIREEHDEISRYPLCCPPLPDCPPPVNIHQDRCMAGNVVFFPINSFELHNSQLITLYNYSEFLKSNLKSKMKLIGYADKETGSEDYNLKLSKKRAENVANVLVNKYGIDRDRLIVESKGSSEQPYKDNKWNRAVVLLVDDE